MWGWFRKRAAPPVDGGEALIALRKRIILMNIPTVEDSFDAGYDMAIDEVLALIDDALNPSASENVVPYGEHN